MWEFIKTLFLSYWLTLPTLQEKKVENIIIFNNCVTRRFRVNNLNYNLWCVSTLPLPGHSVCDSVPLTNTKAHSTRKKAAKVIIIINWKGEPWKPQ